MRRAAPLMTLLAACSGEVVAIDLPMPDGMASLVVGIEDDRLRMFAVDLTAPNPALPNVRDFDDETRLYALYYDAPLEDVNLAPGEILEETDPARRVPLPDFTAAFLRDVGSGDSTDWEATSTAGSGIDFAITAPPPDLGHCPTTFVVERFDLDTQEQFHGAVVMGEDVLAFGEQGTVLRVNAAGVEEVAAPARVGGILDAEPDLAGRIWLGVREGMTGGALLRGHPMTGYERVATFSTPVGWLSGPRPSDRTSGEEVFALTHDATIVHYRDGVVTTADDFRDPTIESQLGGIAWRAPGWAAAFPAGSDTFVTHDERGTLNATFTGETNLQKFSAMTRLLSEEIVVLSRGGYLLGPAPSGATTIPQGLEGLGLHDVAIGVKRMAPLASGFVYARVGLTLVYGEVRKATCPDYLLENLFDDDVSRYSRYGADSLVTFGNRIVLVGAADASFRSPDKKTVVLMATAVFP